MLPPIDQLNQLSDRSFLDATNILFESAPPLARYLLIRRPYRSYYSLISTAEAALWTFTPGECLDVINAHPRLGAPRETLSSLSSKEQVEGSSVIMRRLAEANREYEAKFGFRFVEFVNGRLMEEMAVVIEEKLRTGTRDEELRRGLEAMMEIARDRLQKLKL